MREALKRVALSLAAGAATVAVIGCLAFLPYSKGRDLASDVLSAPGSTIAGLFYPEGLHTGSGSPGWATLAYTSNVLCYTLLWFAALRMFRRRRLDGSGRPTGG